MTGAMTGLGPKPPERPRRSALFLPASSPRAIAKARQLPADVIILDLEDAVAPEAKEAARAAAMAALREGGFGTREVVVRVNALGTPWGAADIAAMAGSGVDAVLVPKIATPADIAAYDAALAGAPPHMALWAMIETCGAVLRLDALGAMAAHTRLGLWVLGTNDLARELRGTLALGRAAFLPFLAQAVAAARAHGLGILDGVYNDFDDLAAFTAEAEQGRMFGCDGKSLIHPSQIAPANAVFAPSATELAWAHAVIAAFAAPENAGKGAIRVAGRMTEPLHLAEAHRLVAFAARVGAAG